MSPDSPDYFRLASALSAPYVTDWRIVLIAPGIVRLTCYERSWDGKEEVLSARGAVVISMEGFEQFMRFGGELVEKWKSAVPPPDPTFVPPGGRVN